MKSLQRQIFLVVIYLMIYMCSLANANGQHYTTLTFGTAEGLSSTITFDAKLDIDNCLWISTDQGIDRYDGHRFKHYSLNIPSTEIKRMSDGNQYHLIQDSQRQLVCFTDKGKVAQYNPGTDSFVELYNAISILGKHSLHAACLDKDLLILGLYNGIYLINLPEKKVHTHLSPDHNIYCIIPFVQGTYLVGSSHGIECLDPEHKSTYALTDLNVSVKSLYYDNEQRKIWIGTNGSGLWVLSLDSGDVRQVQGWERSIINNISPYGNSQLIVGTDGEGVLQTSRLYNSPLQQIASDQPNAPYRLPVAGIQGLLIDDQNIWICAWGGGISLLYADSPISRLEQNDAQALSEKRANDIDVDQEGNIWVAFNRSIVCFNHETRKPEKYLTSQAPLLSVLCAKDGTIWCGGYTTGLYHIDPQSKKVFHLPSVTGGTINNSIYSLQEDHFGRIWVGGLNIPLSCITPSEHLSIGEKDIDYHSTNAINDILQINDTTIAAASAYGLILINLNSGQERTILGESDSIRWKGTSYMTSLGSDKSGNVFIATEGSGLIIYNIKTQNFVNYSTNHGLPSNYLRSIEVQNDTLLWISTSGCGLFLFDTHSGQVLKQYNRSNGLASEEFYRHASKTGPNGDVYFGGRESVEILSAHIQPEKKHNKHILLTNVGLGQEESLNYITHPDIIDQPLDKVKRVYLPYGERSLRLTFSINDLYHQSDYRFQYKLDDTDYPWQTLEPQRTLSFYTLPPGKHYLTIKCINGYGEIAQRELIIEALQTPWLQWPAMLCYALLVLLLVFAAIIAYLKHLSNMAAEEKIHFFNSVAHDIRTPLSLVSTPLTDLEQYISPDAPSSLLPLIRRNMQHLTDVVSQLSLFNSDQQGVQQMLLEPISLNEFSASLAEAYRPVVLHHNLELNTSIPEQEIWVKGDIKALTRICDNLMGNAIKFTPKGSISICIKQSSKYGEIEIKDTGIGMSEDVKKKIFKHFFRGSNAEVSSTPGFGLGLMYSYQVSKKMHGTMTCISKEGEGSSLTIHLPLSKAGNTKQYKLSDLAQYLPIEDSEEKALYSNLRYNVLIVEDNPDLLDYLREKLSKGYNVSCSKCVDEARKNLKEHSADLIISDIMMPGMRGDDWCQELKNDIETSHIPIILLTAATDHSQELHGLSIGADDYIKKPFDTNVLLAKIRNIFDAKRKMHAHYLRIIQKENNKATQKNLTLDKNQRKTPNIDEEFIQRLMKVIDKYISHPDLSVNDLAREMAMSHTLFYEKVNKLIGMPPASLIRSCRMKHAKVLLQEHKYSVSEVAMLCGFTDAKNFSTAFKKFYGISPSKIE